MKMNNIQDGVYNAIPTVAAVYEKNDSLRLEVHFTLCDENGNAYTQTGTDGKEYPVEKYKYYSLVNAQGAVNTKVVEGICAWSKWDGTDPFWWTDAANVDGIGMVEVTLKMQTYNGKSYQNVEWVNELGHSAKHGAGKITESGDKAAIMAKYGAKFKAAFGGKPKTVPTAGKPAPAAAPKTAPVAKTVPTPTRPAPKTAPAKTACPYPDGMDGANKAWDEFNAANPDATQSDLTDRWFEAIDKYSDGKDQQDMTGRQWAQVMAELSGGDPDDLPF